MWGQYETERGTKILKAPFPTFSQLLMNKNKGIIINSTQELIFIFDSVYYLFSFWPYGMGCGILVSWPGVEPVPPALEVQILNHWTASEVQGNFIFFLLTACVKVWASLPLTGNSSLLFWAPVLHLPMNAVHPLLSFQSVQLYYLKILVLCPNSGLQAFWEILASCE